MDPALDQLVYIKAIYHQMLDKAKQRGESSEFYSFTACVKTNISRMIACRLKWDVWSSRDIPLCARVDQLLECEAEDEEI
jgi:hypothetical protein